MLEMGGADESVAAKVARLLDTEEIRRLVVDYARHMNEKDFSAYARLFAEEGEWVGGPYRAVGHAAIEEMVRGMVGPFMAPEPFGDIHIDANAVIDLEGDRATGRAGWIFVVRGEGGAPVIDKIGHYDDEYIREDGSWRFKRRESFIDLPPSP